MTFIAKQTIFFGTAAAHQPGDVVPDENVEANGWQDLVVKEGTKAAEKVREDPTPTGAPPPAPKPS